MKKLTDIQAKALKYINDNKIEELLYIKKHRDLFGITVDENGDSFVFGDQMFQTFCWTHKEAKIEKEGWHSPEFDWCIDGKTIKALFAREILIPSIYADGKYGEYPIGYKINNDVFSNYLLNFRT